MDYDLHTEYPEVAPRAASTIHTMRSVGYVPESALADLIDNSITAGAKNVEVEFVWAGRDSLVTVQDDGKGMAAPELIEALRLGSGDPRAARGPRDLGRFGMGLKTASFAQCRRLTVLTRKEGHAPAHYCWDLGRVAETNLWQLIRTRGPAGIYERLQRSPTGTIVVWEELDRLAGRVSADSEDGRDRFWKTAKRVKTHLGMVFHRFLESRRVRITLNGDSVEPWNPFMPGAEGGQVLAHEELLDGRVTVKSYVLPHMSRLSGAELERGGGIRGWTGMQGFYVYRNERMLVAGSWLGLARRREDTKLARLMVDITSADDEAWQIDIKKSVARPPAGLTDDLDRLARQAQSASRRVYRHRGASMSGLRGGAAVAVWEELLRHGRRFYRVNRSHPAVAIMLEVAGAHRNALEAALRIIEETVPMARIFSDVSEATSEPPEPLSGEADVAILAMIQAVYPALVARSGEANAADEIKMMEPFCLYPALVERFLASQR